MLRLIALFLILTALLSAEWITPKGKTYHTHSDCIALRTTKEPIKVTAAEAARRGLRLCGICARRKEQ